MIETTREHQMRALTPRPAHGASGTEKDPRWAAVVARDREPTGRSTTRSRRPACIAGPRAGRARRTPRTCSSIRRADAERAGFRPCKRCKPDQPPLEQRHAATVARVCRAIEAAESCQAWPTLASRAGLSPPLPSGLQDRHRADAAGVRGGASRRAGSRRAEAERDGDRGHLRGRLQLQRPLLRDVRRDAGHDADATSARAARTPTSASPSASAPSVPFWSPRAQRASAPSCSATIPMRWRAISRTASPARR